MKTLALATIYGLSAAVNNADAYNFMKYMAKHNKEYENAEEYNFRFNEWRKVDRHIELHNSSNATWTLGHNHMSDWTDEERKSLNGYRSQPRTQDRDYNPVWLEPSNSDGVNWVERGAVTEPINQASCGSSWAFSVVGALEGAHWLATGDLV